MFSGPDRTVIYTAEAVQSLNDLPDAASEEIRSSIEQFLDDPSEVLTEEVKDGVHRIDCEPYRALATDCRAEQLRRELIVVQDIYLKKNEADYFAYLNEYADYGVELQQEFQSLELAELKVWLDQNQHDPKVMVVST